MATKTAKKAAPKKAAPKAAKKAAPAKKAAAAKPAAKKAAAPKKAAPAKKAAPKKAAKPAKKTARKPNAAFMRALTPSPTLAAIIGNKAVPRTEVVKKIWDYIRANKLQDKTNKRNINADDKLKPLFGGKGQASMFDLAKYISKHLS